jgi:hypothetical protein
MDKLTQWFKSNGDHFLNSLSVLLLASGKTSMYVPMITALAAVLHMIFIPDQPVAATAPPAVAPTTPPAK